MNPTTTPVTGEALTRLAEMLAKATGPDRMLDGDIAFALNEVPAKFPNRAPRQSYLWSDGRPGLHASTWMPPSYTASIDAALALVERLLPGWAHANGNVGEQDMPWACLTEPVEPCRDFASHAVTEPLAILSSLIAAIAAASPIPTTEPDHARG